MNKSKINIGMVLHSDVKNDTRVLNEISALHEFGWNIFILIPFSGYENEITKYSEYTICQLTLSNKTKNLIFGLTNFLPIFSLFWSARIRKFIRQFDINILHAHDLYMGEPALKAISLEKKVPVIIDLHENYPAAVKEYEWTKTFPRNIVAKNYKWKLKEKKILQGASGIIVLSDTYKEKLIFEYSFIDHSSFAIYPNVPNIKKMLSQQIQPVNLDKNGFCLFYFGAIGKRRGLQTAVRGLQLIQNKGFDCKLLIIGPIDKYEQKFFNDLFKSKGVTHIPYIDISLLKSYIQFADLCISPLKKNEQHESGVANKIFQYMLYKKALLVSDCEPQKAIVNENGCGMVHVHNSPSDFAKKVEEVINDKSKLTEMATRGYDAVISKYNNVNMGKNIHELYKKVLG